MGKLSQVAGRFGRLFLLTAVLVFAQVDPWLSKMSSGNRLRLSGDLSAAEIQYRSALELARVSGNDGPYAYTLNNLAGVYQDRGSYTDAEAMLQRAVGLLESNADTPHRDFALSYNNLGSLYSQMGRFSESEAAHGRAIHISEQAGGRADDQLAIGLAAVGGLYVEVGHTQEGEIRLRRALPLAQRALGPSHRTTVHILLHLGALQYGRGECSRAEASWREALSAIGNSPALQDRFTAATLQMNLGELKRFERRYAQSESLLLSAVAVFENTGNGSHPLRPSALNHLALTYAEQGKTAEAERTYLTALAILESSPDMQSRVRRQHAVVLSNFAKLRKQQSAPAEAAALLGRALVSAEMGYGSADPSLKPFLHDYATMLRDAGRKGEAREYERRASRIPAKTSTATVDVRDMNRAEHR